jgi:hypothetical protein
VLAGDKAGLLKAFISQRDEKRAESLLCGGLAGGYLADSQATCGAKFAKPS